MSVRKLFVKDVSFLEVKVTLIANKKTISLRLDRGSDYFVYQGILLLRLIEVFEVLLADDGANYHPLVIRAVPHSFDMSRHDFFGHKRIRLNFHQKHGLPYLDFSVEEFREVLDAVTEMIPTDKRDEHIKGGGENVS